MQEIGWLVLKALTVSETGRLYIHASEEGYVTARYENKDEIVWATRETTLTALEALFSLDPKRHKEDGQC